MALLERDSALAAPAEYGEQARSGCKRLVLVAGAEHASLLDRWQDAADACDQALRLWGSSATGCARARPPAGCRWRWPACAAAPMRSGPARPRSRSWNRSAPPSSGPGRTGRWARCGWSPATAARRGEPDAWPCLDEAVAGADGTGEPQYVVPVRLARAEAQWLAGDLAAARREAELAADAAGAADQWLRGETAVWLRRTGSTREVAGPVAEPYARQLAGDRRAAADAWLARDCRFDAAMALVDSADDAELREALALLDGTGAVATARVRGAGQAGRADAGGGLGRGDPPRPGRHPDLIARPAMAA
jgi:hypothetical protein